MTSSELGGSHNYEFAHVGLRILFCNNPAPCFHRLTNETHGLRWLKWFWRKRIGENVPSALRQPPNEMTIEPRVIGDHHLLLVTPSTAQTPPDAQAIGLVVDRKTRGDREARYFVFELTYQDESDDAEGRKTVFGEWTADGEHIHYGPAPDSDTNTFVELIENRLVQR